MYAPVTVQVIILLRELQMFLLLREPIPTSFLREQLIPTMSLREQPPQRLMKIAKLASNCPFQESHHWMEPENQKLQRMV